jgi:hypothetical protein
VFVIPLKFLLERLLVMSCMNYEAKKSSEAAQLAGRSGKFSAMSSKSRKGARSGKAGSPSKRYSSRSSRPPADAEAEEQVGFSAKPGNSGASSRQPSSQLIQQDNSGSSSKTWSEKLQGAGGLSKKNRAVSFRSSRVALDENYMSDLDGQQAEFSFSTKIAQYTARYARDCVYSSALIPVSPHLSCSAVCRYNVAKRVRQEFRERWWHMKRAVARSAVVVWVKLQYSLLQHRLVSCWSNYWNKPEVSPANLCVL